MLAALDLASAGVGFAVGAVLAIALVLALGRLDRAWRLDWRLQVSRDGPQQALRCPESDATGSPAVVTPEGDQGKR